MKRTISKLTRSSRTRSVYSKVLVRTAKEFVFGGKDRKATYEPAYPKKITIKTVFPDSTIPYNEWCKEYNVSARIPK
jgi:hypothetical protein